MIKKIGILILVLAIPAVLALSSWQSSRFDQLEREVGRLEDQQGTWLESNKRHIAGISTLLSVERIDRLAQEGALLVRVPSERIIQVEIAQGRNVE